MKKSKVLMIIGAILLAGLFIFPLWNITLEAPQYPEPIGMDIWINKITDHNPNDLKNINLMNHYVGMKEIPEHLKEFEIFPYVVMGMIVLGLIFGFMGNHKLPLGVVRLVVHIVVKVQITRRVACFLNKILVYRRICITF